MFHQQITGSRLRFRFYDIQLNIRQWHSTKDSYRDVTPSVIDLIKRFPSGSLSLLASYRTYQNILDASKTPLNAWTKLGHIPRRQAEQVRKFKRDFKKVILPVLFAAIPIIGNSIFIPIAMSPNLFLSSHFLKGYEVQLAQREYSNRAETYEACLNELVVILDLPLSLSEEDLVNHLNHCSRISWDIISRKHIQLLARASGIPIWLAHAFPSYFLKRKLNHIGRDILEDNMDLIREKHHLDSCQRLTDEEVLQVCSLRGLNLDGSMRSTLCTYLSRMHRIISQYSKQQMNEECSEGIKIMTLHLSMISIS